MTSNSSDRPRGFGQILNVVNDAARVHPPSVPTEPVYTGPTTFAWYIDQQPVYPIYQGGSGVENGYGYIRRDKGDPGISVQAIVDVPELASATLWSALVRWRIHCTQPFGIDTGESFDIGLSISDQVSVNLHQQYDVPAISFGHLVTWAANNTIYGDLGIGWETWYWVRIEGDLTGNVRYRYWADGDPEPGTWYDEQPCGDYRGFEMDRLYMGGAAAFAGYTDVDYLEFEFDNFSFIVGGAAYTDLFERTLPLSQGTDCWGSGNYAAP